MTISAVPLRGILAYADMVTLLRRGRRGGAAEYRRFAVRQGSSLKPDAKVAEGKHCTNLQDRKFKY